MQIPIKFDRSLRPEWIDFALESLCSSDFDTKRTRDALRKHLEGQVDGRVALSKTITQIMRVVGPDAPWSQEELVTFRKEMDGLASSERTTIHLRLLRAIPFFNEFCATLSRFAELGTTRMPLAPVRDRINALYGERPIIRQSLFCAFRTLQAMDIVEREGQEWKVTRPETLLVKS